MQIHKGKELTVENTGDFTKEGTNPFRSFRDLDVEELLNGQ